MLIKPAEGKSYAEVLGGIRAKLKPEETETSIRSIRRTRNGEVLLELGKETKNAKAFGEALQGHLGDMGTMWNLTPKVTLEFLDLDSVTIYTKGDVEEALKRDLGEKAGDAKMSVTKPNRREQILAIVELNEEEANKLLETPRIKVGWINSRVRRRARIDRCYKCMGYGHQARECKGPDCSSLCYKCGLAGHRASVCTAEPLCMLCKRGISKPENLSLNHIPGTEACYVFRQALDKAKRNQRR